MMVLYPICNRRGRIFSNQVGVQHEERKPKSLLQRVLPWLSLKSLYRTPASGGKVLEKEFWRGTTRRAQDGLRAPQPH